jgi:hypothetical protein
MNIAYCGGFLGEGLRQCGHDVTDITLDREASLTELAETAGGRPDLVLLELWGDTPLPADIATCPFRLAVFCVDTPLSAFWLRHLAQVCDDVFVDQRSGVAEFARVGVKASWLPLCVSGSDIMPDMEKDYFISFVGRTTVFRTKRTNLLRLIGKHFPLHLAQSLTRREMLTLFARSQVVLNENLFDGLTLRVFQGLASGATLLTESGDGLDALFRPGQDLLTFDAANVLHVLDALEKHPERYQEIGRRGRERCATHHTSTARARTFLERIADDSARNPRRPAEERRLAEARARYCHALRHGGPYATSITTFAQAVAAGGPLGADAAHWLGSILARQGETAKSLELLTQAAELPGLEGFLAAAKRCLTFLYHDDLASAGRALATAVSRLPRDHVPRPLPELAGEANPRQALFLFLAEVLLAAGRVFDLGFLKPRPERYPDYAFEYAGLAWQEGHSAAALDLLIRCAEACQAQPEIMDALKTAVAEGLATDRQILYAAELALRLYDPETAAAITDSFRRARRLTSGQKL